jgi:hypothetical protein
MMTTLEKVRRLEEYLAGNTAIDPVVETTINKLLNREQNRLLELKNRLTHQLLEFEAHYSLKSPDFYRRYEAGDLGDAIDYVEWAATVEMLNNVKHRLTLLAEP